MLECVLACLPAWPLACSCRCCSCSILLPLRVSCDASCACVRARMRAGVRARVRVCVCACVVVFFASRSTMVVTVQKLTDSAASNARADGPRWTLRRAWLPLRFPLRHRSISAVKKERKNVNLQHRRLMRVMITSQRDTKSLTTRCQCLRNPLLDLV